MTWLLRGRKEAIWAVLAATACIAFATVRSGNAYLVVDLVSPSPGRLAVIAEFPKGRWERRDVEVVADASTRSYRVELSRHSMRELSIVGIDGTPVNIIRAHTEDGDGHAIQELPLLYADGNEPMCRFGWQELSGVTGISFVSLDLSAPFRFDRGYLSVRVFGVALVLAVLGAALLAGLGRRLWEFGERYSQLVAFALVAAVVFFRFWQRITVQDLWAEDGTEFLVDALQQGFGALFKPYTGYLHVAPRLIVTLATQAIPLPYAPGVIAATCLLLWTAIATWIASRRFEWLIRNGWLRILTAVCLCSPAGSNEVLGNAANLHWALLVFAALAFLSDPELELGWPAVGALAVTALSTGELIVLLPAAAARVLIAVRSSEASARTMAWAAFASVAGNVIIVLFVRAGESAIGTNAFADALMTSYRALVRWSVLNPVLNSVQSWLAPVGVGLVLFLLCFGVSRAMNPSRSRVASPLVASVGFGLVTLPALIALARPGVAPYFAADWSGPGVRYFFIPSALGVLGWCLAGSALLGCQRYHVRLAGALVVAVVGVQASRNLSPVGPLQPLPQWAEMVRDGHCGRGGGIPISPPGWSVPCSSVAR